MNQPHPTDKSHEQLPQSFGVLFWVMAILATSSSVVLGFIGSFIVPAFEEVFKSFGSNLPIPTLLVFHVQHLLWLPLAVTAIFWVVSWKTSSQIKYRSRVIKAFIILGFVDAAMIVGVVCALYLPMFFFGSVTQ